jgi:hypothetical protein
MFWVTAIGVLMVAAGTGVTSWQAVMSREALDAAIAQQRAWVRVEIDPTRDLSWTKDGISAEVRLTLTNSGNLPALSVLTSVSATARQIGGIGKNEPLRTAQCDGAAGIGVTVFPGETVTTREPITISAKDIPPGSDDLEVAVLGCAAYQDRQGAPTRHTDRSVILMPEITGRHLIIGLAKGDLVDAKDINARDSISGNRAD